MTIDDILDGLIQREGGFVNHQADKGGATNHGVTAVTLGRYRRLGRPATPREVEQLTEGEAREIYAKEYVVKPGFLDLPEPVRTQVVDDGVMSGPDTAIKTLQRVLRVEQDGIIGPKTRAALAAADPEAVARALVRERAMRLVRIVKHNPSQIVFLEGWLSRALSFLS